MEPEVYILVNSEGICENKFVWDGVSEWTPPENTLISKVSELGIDIPIGKVVKQNLPGFEDPIEEELVTEETPPETVVVEETAPTEPQP